MKKLLFATVFISLSSGSSFAKEVYCMGSEIKLDINNKTLSSSTFNVQNQKASLNVTKNNREGTYTLTMENENFFLVSKPHTYDGWSGDENTTLSKKASGETISSECILYE